MTGTGIMGTIEQASPLCAPHPIFSRSHESPEQADIVLNYFDSTLPSYSWKVLANWGVFYMIALSERMTLPSDAAYVDSVRIAFDALTGDSLTVALYPDTLYQGFHLIKNFLVPNAAYAVATIYPSPSGGDTTVTVAFPHVLVPKEFHVAIIPINTAPFAVTAAFLLHSDSESTIPRTAENARACYAALFANGAVQVGSLDSIFIPTGYSAALYSNLEITSYVQSASEAVPVTDRSTMALGIYPNPASNTLSFNYSPDLGVSSLELLDLLGRIVLSSKISDNQPIDVSHLVAGRYQAILQTPNGFLIAPVIIRR